MMSLFYILLLVSLVHAFSWFSSGPDYAKWSDNELRIWLEQRNIKVPPSFDKPHLYDLVDANWHSIVSRAESGRQWSIDQYDQAQRAFQHIKDKSFDQWDESKLRTFLLELGVVAPSGPREQLILLAKNKHRAYTDAAAIYSSLASGSLTSTYASATDAADSASKCIHSAVAQVADEVTRAFDDTKDHVYSTWDDSHLRNWLQGHGVVEAKSARTRDELTKLANDYYSQATFAVWESWSDSYIREWLIAHNLLKPSDSLPRSSLLEEMKKYYYRYTDKVWNTWSNSELESWLVNHHVLSSDAQKKQDELIRMVEEHYASASDSVWGAWTDSEIRQWLAENGHLGSRNDVKNRHDLVDLINSKYPGALIEVTSYLLWPDTRLRAYLRERGISGNALPTNRPGLLQETRIRWVQTSTRTETTLAKIKEIINSSVEAVEEKIARVLEVLSGNSRDATPFAADNADDASECANMKKSHGWNWVSHGVDKAREKVENVRQSAEEEWDHAAKRTSQSIRKKIQGAGGEL